MLLLCALIVGNGSAWAIAYSQVYNLAFSKLTSGTNYSSYASEHTITVSTIGWGVYGNQSLGDYVRVGGAKGTNVTRTIKGNGTISKAISKITVNHNGVSNANLTINSVTLTVASNAAFTTDVVSKVLTPNVSSAGSFDFTPTTPSTEWAANRYYKFTIDYTHDKSSNYGLDITSIVFYETTSNPIFTASDVNLEYNDTEGEITYSLANPVDGATVTATSTDDWISNISVESATKVSFEAEENTGVVDRSGTITLNYVKDASTLTTKAVTITQGHFELADPVFSPAGGFYSSEQNVSLSCETTSSSIYYTTDGSTPTTSSTLYSSAISINENTTIKAVSYKDSHYSNVITADYIIDAAYANCSWDLSKASYDASPTTELIQWSDDAATMKNERNGDGNTAVNNYIPTSQSSTRFYNKNKVTITPNSSNVIKSVVFTAMSEGYATAFKNSTWTNATAVASGSTVTVTPVNGGANIVANITGTCGFSAVKVNYSTNENVTIGSSKYASYCTKKALNFTGLGVKAYKAKVEDNQVKLTKVTMVPADAGVVLFCDAPGTYNIPVTSTASALSENEMVGVTERTLVEWETGGDGKYNYILQAGEFKKAGTGGYLKANRAYLHTAFDVTSVGARSLEIVFDDEETTGIKQVDNSKHHIEEYFNLNGQRVAQPTKGLYIVNGRKVVIK